MQFERFHRHHMSKAYYRRLKLDQLDKNLNFEKIQLSFLSDIRSGRRHHPFFKRLLFPLSLAPFRMIHPYKAHSQAPTISHRSPTSEMIAPFHTTTQDSISMAHFLMPRYLPSALSSSHPSMFLPQTILNSPAPL